jgi:hypothetical protein
MRSVTARAIAATMLTSDRCSVIRRMFPPRISFTCPTRDVTKFFPNAKENATSGEYDAIQRTNSRSPKLSTRSAKARI